MNNAKILIAEDEGLLRILLADVLKERGLRVLEASDGEQALEMLRSDPGVLLLLSDVKMPRMSGYILMEHALDLRPELKILMMTAYSSERPSPKSLVARKIRTLTKPFDMDGMADLVCEMLARP
jgi:DNA-binding NtrC family response regulator